MGEDRRCGCRGEEDGASLREEEDAGTGWRGKTKNVGGRLLLKKKMGLGLGLLYFFFVVKIAPLLLCLSCGPVFIGKMLHGSQNWSLNFLSSFFF